MSWVLYNFGTVLQRSLYEACCYFHDFFARDIAWYVLQSSRGVSELPFCRQGLVVPRAPVLNLWHPRRQWIRKPHFVDHSSVKRSFHPCHPEVKKVDCHRQIGEVLVLGIGRIRLRGPSLWKRHTPPCNPVEFSFVRNPSDRQRSAAWTQPLCLLMTTYRCTYHIGFLVVIHQIYMHEFVSIEQWICWGFPARCIQYDHSSTMRRSCGPLTPSGDHTTGF